MAFRFTLESLLRHRRNIERLRELLLQQADAEVALVRVDIFGVDVQTAQLDQSEAVSLRTEMRASELQWAEAQRLALHAYRQRLKKKLEESLQKRSARLVEFQLAKRQREVLEKLHQREWEIYRAETERREQGLLDDMHLSRCFYLSHHARSKTKA